MSYELSNETDDGLQWIFDEDRGEWESPSVIHDEGSPFKYRINMRPYGQFSLDKSDVEIISQTVRMFHSLKEAMDYCEACETRNKA